MDAFGTLISLAYAGRDDAASELSDQPAEATAVREVQVTDRPVGHIVTNTNIWSPDSKWIVYDTRSDPAGEKFDGITIEMVNVETHEVREVYRARNGAHCGVATFSPVADKVVFILGPENPTDDWQYSVSHRQGVVVDVSRPGHAAALDGRDLTPPFTPGALRGGTHVHVFSGDGQWVSFTYDDHVLEVCDLAGDGARDRNQRNVGVSAPARTVQVPKTHPRNHDGSAFSVLVTRTVNEPQPGSDEISRAFEEAWIGTNGYVRPDGTRQRRAIAFQGQIVAADRWTINEAYVVDLPDDVTVAGDAPLEGTATTRPVPPRGTTQRRLTRTEHRKYPGLQGPRHWLRSSPDGTQIALLMRDNAGVVQLWTISPNGGEPQQITDHTFDVTSASSWSSDGRRITYIADQSVFVTEVATGEALRLTVRTGERNSPRPEACVFSPDGRRIAYIRPIEREGRSWNQVFVVTRD